MSTDPQQASDRQEERTGGVRIHTEMWVRVIGRDSERVRRSGNICASGFFFEVERWPGRPGDIAVMEVSSEDSAHSFTTLASLVKVYDVREARFSSIEQGVSFRFLPSDEATRSAIARTCRHIAEQHPEQAGGLVLEDFQRAAAEGEYASDVKDTRPCIETGEKVVLIVDSSVSGGKREVTGVVGDITESVQADGATRFWVPVYLVEESDVAAEPRPVADEGATEAAALEQVAADGGRSLIDEMWTELVPEAQSILGEAPSESSPTGSSQLSGRLSQVAMPSALWLLDQERLSGALEFRRPGEKIVLFLREGSVIDAESPDHERDPRGHLSALMGWDDGEFEFRAETVDRPDRIGVPTQGLLLDLAVASDEEAR
jgi:hypothetical protein